MDERNINDIRSIQFIDSYFPVIDGVIETVHNYASNMNAVVVCPRMTRHYDTRDLPYQVLACPAVRIPNSQYAIDAPFFDIELMKKLEELHPDILHIHSPAMLGEYALIAGHKLGIPVVATFHSKVYDAVLEYTKSRELAKVASHTTAHFYERCDEVWACSEGTAETLRSYGYKGDITIMTNGTNITYPVGADSIKHTARKNYGIPENKNILLFVGQMVWYKNIRLILDTFRLLCDRSDDYCMVFAGTGKDMDAISEYAGKLKLTKDQVILTDKISDRMLLSGLYLCGDLFFFPSVYDNTPLVMREAAALGLPSLVTEGSNASESVVKDVNGFTAKDDPRDMCNEIERIFADPGMLQAAGENAKETIPIQWHDLIPEVKSKYLKIIENYHNKKSEMDNEEI